MLARGAFAGWAWNLWRSAMGRRRSLGAAGDPPDIEGSLAALDAPALRSLVREVLDSSDALARTQVVRALVEHAARAGSGWAPARVSEGAVEQSMAFARAARRAGHADPVEVDVHLARASDAFLRRDYAAAGSIFGALLEPIGDGDIDLGQEEMAYEVLGTDLDACAARAVVSAYMTSAPAERPRAVRHAIEKASGVGHFHEPVAEMERVAVEPLPDLDAFLPAWRAVVEKEAAEQDSRSWGGAGAWLREVARRMDGAAGLAAVARASGGAEDLRAWCRSLVEAKDWKAALAAFEEAAEAVKDSDYARGDFLDGAALAARELGRRDVPERLERAWRSEPTMLRLARWLETAGNAAALRKRAVAALDGCPREEKRQRALLHVIAGDLAPAAKLLAAAPGLGWSSDDHPGHLLLPLFQALLSGRAAPLSKLRLPASVASLGEFEDDDDYAGEEDGAEPQARLEVPDLGGLLVQAGVGAVTGAAERAVLLGCMRKAAERRLAGVTEHKRRRHYDHAAQLVAAVLACDTSPETARWVAGLRATYSRYPALRSAMDRRTGRR